MDKKKIVLKKTFKVKLSDKQAKNEAKFLLSDTTNEVMGEFMALFAIEEMAKDGHEGYIRIDDNSHTRLFKIEDIAQSILDDLEIVKNKTKDICDKLDRNEDINKEDIERIMETIAKELELEI